MAHLQFSLPQTSGFDSKVWETAYITGIEGIPWLCEHTLKDHQFSIGRQIDESGKVNIVWPSKTFGSVCLSTTSLRLNEDWYSLPTEIARGTVYRVHSQIAEWQRVGLRLPDQLGQLAEYALDQLLHALTSGSDSVEQAEFAQNSIEAALKTAVGVSEAFSLQALEARKNNEGRLATLLGCSLGIEPQLSQVGDAVRTAFNLACVSADFKTLEPSTGKPDFSDFDAQVEWVSSSDQKLCIGPMVDFRDGKLPDWMMLLDDGFESVLQSACQHVQKIVERYRGKAHLWNCATGINVPNRLGWSDEESLRMAVSLIETVRRTDDRSPVLLTIDQPWSEYLRKDAEGISPLHFADALIRADLGLSGLALELNMDRWPGGSFPRDPIELNRLIDRWSMLGLPLMISITSPTGIADQDTHRVTNWHRDQQDLEAVPSGAGYIHPESLIRLLLSKPAVHAIIWNCLTDSDAPGESLCGLWRSSGKAKPLLANLAKLRKTCLH